MFRNRRSFTLIELLVVIAIIGILAGLVATSLNSARAKARDARRISDMKAIQTALEMYYADYGKYPPFVRDDRNCNGWDSIVDEVFIGAEGKNYTSYRGSGTGEIKSGLVDLGYLKAIPSDPAGLLSKNDQGNAICGNYRYYRYDAGGSTALGHVATGNVCDSTRGAFYVLGVNDMESVSSPPLPEDLSVALEQAPGSQILYCNDEEHRNVHNKRNWGREFEWMTYGFENE